LLTGITGWSRATVFNLTYARLPKAHHSLTEAEIEDWKSYYQIIDVDTFQSKFYPLLLMSLNPSLEKVKFVLEFVRYGSFA
jgi:hypothetical protein